MIKKGSFIDNPLRRSMIKNYGDKALNIYDECCRAFGWDSSQRYLFDKHRILYAEGATQEGYSPWFLAHSNLTETEGGTWYNEIHGDTIEEIWKEAKYGLYHDETTRVTFAKNRLKVYMFIGIYKPIKVEEKMLLGKKVWVKTYQRIADTYPIENK